MARLNGTVDFLELETFMNVNRPAPPLPTNFLQHRGTNELSVAISYKM